MDKEEMKNKYSSFITEISEILGLGKPVDILKLCEATDLFFRPLDKRITELEKENAELKYQLNKNPCVKIPDWHCSDCLKEIAELKEQNTNLQEMLKTERSVTCKEEYLKKVTELEQENAELKAVERMALYSRMSDRLAKAEELLLELYDCIPSSMADSCKETLQKVALFFKDSEVAK